MCVCVRIIGGITWTNGGKRRISMVEKVNDESYGMVDRRVTRKIALSGDDGGDYEAAGTG